MPTADLDAALRSWAASGSASLTGDPNGPPDLSRYPVLVRAAAVSSRIETLAGALGRGVQVDPAALLTERAAARGFSRRGTISCGGAGTLIEAADAWWAITLSRPDDLDLVQALIGCGPVDTVDAAVAALTDSSRAASAADMVWRGAELGLPVAVLGATAAARPVRTRVAEPRAGLSLDGALVVDLTSMWAGPLCGRLLCDMGATVVKVEGRSRPDGARFGERTFFDRMNHGKLSYTTDFDGDIGELGELIDAADVVLEASRPRALQQRGLAAQQRSPRPGRVWLRITGHDRRQHPNRTAFGDDAAVSGGLVGSGAHGPVFCADAVADPLTGLESTVAVLESLISGGGEVIDVSMAAVSAEYASVSAGEPPPTPELEANEWWFRDAAGRHLVGSPVASTVPTPAALPLGSSNAEVRKLLDRRTR